MTESPGIFEPAHIGGIALRNRFIRSATHEGMADAEGAPLESLEKLYLRLARGGAGAIVTGYAGVNPQGRCSFPGMLMMHSDALVPAYRRLVEAVHREGVPIIMQLAHCGAQTRSAVTGTRTVAPSPVRDRYFSEELPMELTEDGIREIINAFINAAVRAQTTGFDGVQLHLAHGYLLAQFLSGYTNRRRDRWGGSPENRFRIVSEIMAGIRQKLGNYPVLAKINGYDDMPGGMRPEEAVKVALMLEASGCCAVEISSGTIGEGLAIMRGPRIPTEALFAANFRLTSLPKLLRPVIARILPLITPASPKPYRNYNLEAASTIRKGVSIPVIAVGGIHTLEDASKAIADGAADFVSMSRPFINDPSIVKKFEDGSWSASRCTMCNYCAIMIEKEPLRCWHGRIPQRV
ncbi:NADH:flavin oxidoreductase [Chlorobium sp. KB01]|uniref:NADH:flavin oxidoreductase n=1 Tax=Chlorobium sp. KB01 TaxID=1917528 RepID=UPI000975B49A|nr:NADH:flavin oxidoreductase [Chlorobium sp. KB01]